MVYRFWDTETSVETDTNQFSDVGEVTLHLPPGSGSRGITSIDIRKESRADHQYVIVMTAGGPHIKMHWGVTGAVIEFGTEIDRDYGIGQGEYTPLGGLTLSDVVGIFYQLAHEKPFIFGEYDCARLASDLAGRLGTYKAGSGEDFDFL